MRSCPGGQRLKKERQSRFLTDNFITVCLISMFYLLRAQKIVLAFNEHSDAMLNERKVILCLCFRKL
jgi:hypothetical protein